MPDESHLDNRYFVDSYVYNCPFCNRRSVSYVIRSTSKFDWTDSKKCTYFIIKCQSCYKESLHLTFKEIEFSSIRHSDPTTYRFDSVTDGDIGLMLDQAFFYSVPTSFFALDSRIPRTLRELLTEAEGCHKGNYLTGASACARKIVFELAVKSGATGNNYEDRINSLKAIHPEVDSVFFDTLLTIHQVTSTKVHENSYDGWESDHVRIILAALSEVLHEIYVVPALRKDRRQALIALKEEVIPTVDNGKPEDDKATDDEKS